MIRNRYKFLVYKPEGTRPLVRPKYGWEDNIKIDVEEIEYRRALVQDKDKWRAVVHTVMKFGLHKTSEFIE
jgi:hypothetical protein